MNERGIGDKSDEGQELRDDIRTYIDEHELDVRVTRSKTNQDLLEDIEDALEVAKDADPGEDPDPEEKPATTSEEPDPEDTGGEDPNNVEDPEDLEPEPAPVRHARPERRRAEHNDDTNEPAARPERRAARPERRRR